MITDACINCGACESECPNHAIYEGSVDWRYSDGTTLSGMITLPNGQTVDADGSNEPLDDDVYYIAPEKCTECKGSFDQPQCEQVCPVDVCIDDPERRESMETLMARHFFLHQK